MVFYGDSITEQRLYTVFAEAFVLTRYPKLNVQFVHSGWGGDRVSGGGGGPIDVRLTRDVLAYRPTVVTVMLGMNDAGYRAFDQGLYDTYTKGMVSIVDRIKQSFPGVRFNLIQPSPFDDVTRPETFPGGYNAVLKKYAAFVADLATKQGALSADLNTPVVQMLSTANTKDAANAQKIIPDRVHPGPGGHLVMAEALLKSWGASGTVSEAVLDARSLDARAVNGKISKQARRQDGALTWTQKDDALPMGLDLSDPVVRLAVESSDLVSSLDRQMLTVSNLLPTGKYALTIDDGQPIATFTGQDLAAGVNLAALDTPMRAQANDVLGLVRAHTDVHQNRWRSVQMGYAAQIPVPEARGKAIKALDDYEKSIFNLARKRAQPVEHRFALVPVQ